MRFYKLFFIWVPFLLFLQDLNALQWLAPAPVIKITRKTPLFDKASSQANVLGDADPETPVLARALSPRGSWILVEDTEGVRVWLPTDRTNYIGPLPVLPPPTERAQSDVAAAPAPVVEIKEPVPPPAAAVSKQPPRRNHNRELGLGFVSHWPSKDSRYSAYPLSLGYIEGASRREALGFRLMYSAYSRKSFSLSFVGRYPWGSTLFREIDLGYGRRSDLQEKSVGGLNASYSIGFFLVPRLSLVFRGGLFWGAGSEWSGGAILRWAF